MTQSYRHPDLTLDQQHSPLIAARHLAEEFSGVLGVETIDRFLHSEAFGGPEKYARLAGSRLSTT